MATLQYGVGNVLTREDITHTRDVNERELDSKPRHHKPAVLSQGFLDASLVRS